MLAFDGVAHGFAETGTEEREAESELRGLAGGAELGGGEERGGASGDGEQKDEGDEKADGGF
jgi:hypothetical protein